MDGADALSGTHSPVWMWELLPCKMTSLNPLAQLGSSFDFGLSGPKIEAHGVFGFSQFRFCKEVT